MTMPRKPDYVEHTAKTLFDLIHHVHDIHENGWPGWVNESDKATYRQLATWHLQRLRKEHAWMRKMSLKGPRYIDATGNHDGAFISLGWILNQLTHTKPGPLVQAYRARQGKESE